MAVKFLNGIDVDGSMNIAASDVPNLDASKITSGTLSADRIPNLSGVYQPAGDYLDLETANTTFQPLGNYLTTTSALDANRISSGTLDGARMPWNTNDGFTGTYSIVWRATNDLYTSSWLQVRGTDDALLTRKIVAGDNPIEARSIGFADAGLLFQDNDSYKCIHPTTMDGTAHGDSISLGWSNNKWKDGYFAGILYANGGNSNEWNAAYDWGNHASAGYLTSLPSHNHDTLYDAIGSANAVGQALNERIDTEVFDAINSKQPAGNYFTDGDTVLNMANNDGLVYNDTNNLMYINADGTNYAIIDSRGGTVTGSINMTGGGTKLSMNNGDIVGVNQLKINDPGEGIVWNNGSSGDITLAVVDDASDNRLNLAGTNASLSINNATVATQSWVSGQGYLTSLPSHNHDTLYDSLGSADAVATALNERIDTEVFDAIATVDGNIPTNNNQLTNGAGYITQSTADARYVNMTESGNVHITGTLRVGSSSASNQPQFWIKNLVNAGDADYNDAALMYLAAGDSDHNGFLMDLDDDDTYSASGNNEFVFKIRTRDNAIAEANDSNTKFLIRPSGRVLINYGSTTSITGDPYLAVNGDIHMSGNKVATESYVNTAVSNLVDSAPGALNTLNELAAALGDDANFSTTVTNNIAAVDTRINDEVIPYVDAVAADASKGVTAYSWGNHAGLYLGATAKAADSNLLDGIDSSAFLRSNTADTATGALTFAGSTRFEGNIGNSSATGPAVLVGLSAGNDPQIQLQGTSTDASPHIDFSNGVGEDFDARIILTGNDTLDISGANLTIGGQTAATQSWVTSQGYLTSIPSTYATDAEVNTAVGAIDTRINDEVIPYIGDVENTANTAYGWGNHASAGYLTSVPSALSVTSLAVGSGATLTESTDRADLLMIKSSTSTWGGLQISNTSNEIIFSLMGDGNTIGLYDDLNNDWVLQRDENGATRLYHNSGSKLSTTSGGISVTGTVTATGGNSTNWNTAYGWGNHASAGYLTSIPSDYVRQGQDIVSGNIHPVGDREQLLGLDSNRWQIVFCEILDSAGQHEKNLQNPAGETSVADYATGTVMVWENGKNVPCTTYANHMRMGIAVENVDSPMIQGAEPVLVTGSVSEGDYLVTSTTTGHAVAVSRDTVKQEQLWDCVIGKALEGGEGESHLIKTWVTI